MPALRLAVEVDASSQGEAMSSISAGRVPAAVVLVLAVACGPEPRSAQNLDSLAVAASVHTTEQAGEVLSEREEAQGNLEAARAFFLGDDMARAAVQLKAAADIDRSHAAAAVEPARTALMQSATELDDLAARVAERGLSAVTPMDTAFARLHLAEVQLHCTRAKAAWENTRAGATAAELLMIADHFERAARDVGYALPPTAVQNVTSLRSIAALLSQTATTKSSEVEPALSRIDGDVHRLLALLTAGSKP